MTLFRIQINNYSSNNGNCDCHDLKKVRETVISEVKDDDYLDYSNIGKRMIMIITFMVVARVTLMIIIIKQ